MAQIFLIIGAGMAGLPIAHYVLKHYADQYDLKVIIVSKSTEFYWNIASPRAVITGQLADDKTFHSIPAAFAQYPPRRFEFIHGTVETWDPDQNSVLVKQNSGSERKIEYRTIVVATGSTYAQGMPWKLVGSSEDTRTALAHLRDKIEKASSIVVGGGGPTGVEVAGELAYEYARAGRKKVLLVMSDALPLPPRVMDATRQAARRELEKLGVNIIANAKVAEVDSGAGNARRLAINKSDGSQTTLEADLFLPTWGVEYNTAFAPSSMLEEDGRLKVTEQLRAPGYQNAFLVGDAASLDSYAASVREAQVRFLVAAIGNHLAAETIPQYKQDGRTVMTVTVGRDRGVGQIKSWNAWSFFIWFFKGRHMCTNIAGDYAAGKTLILGKI
ncbi:unnamed protein product [Periconia digitata]|uniref:FAD/NAD(P)-binding domain-containing protein n=1 Tax=Periconia digitata TaxID=1303443 RepID=A0A9W4UDI2_9PLEO|nr:unnamed protein product [Periconia digitata]